MQPLQDLLHRIKWDPEFGNGEFTLGYEDRIAHEEKIVPFAATRIDPQRPDAFSFQDEDGIVEHIPLHRVRAVYRNGVVIWQRPGHVKAGGRE